MDKHKIMRSFGVPDFGNVGIKRVQFQHFRAETGWYTYKFINSVYPVRTIKQMYKLFFYESVL